MLSRRQFLKNTGLLATGILTAGSIGCSPFRQESSRWLVSACTDKAGLHYVAAIDLAGNLINKVKIPARGHACVAIPEKPTRAIVFARRPGNFAIEVDFQQGKVIREIYSNDGFHMYGHGIIVNNNLVTTENDFIKSKGIIVVRDLESGLVVNQFDSGGIGPHELALMPNNKQIVVANGGIKTHPSQPRKKLNLDTMKPNLAYLSIDSGQIDGFYELENHKSSIRHLAVSKTGKVIAGLQYQGAKNDLVPLAISHQGSEPAKYLQASDDVWRRLNQYTASVCIDDESGQVAISCPRADLITFWCLVSGDFIKSSKLADGAGLAKIGKIYASNGKGRIVDVVNKENIMPFEGLKWDNHLIST